MVRRGSALSRIRATREREGGLGVDMWGSVTKRSVESQIQSCSFFEDRKNPVEAGYLKKGPTMIMVPRCY